MMNIKRVTPTPHDALFRQFMATPQAARDLIELHMPTDLRDLCDLSTLKLEQGSFIDEDLRSYFCDVLYSLKTTGGDGYIHVLIEHQSSPDRHMAFRLMRYAIAVMHRHLEAGHKKLPLVVPILFYAGRQKKYPFSNNWLDDFDDPLLAEQLYRQPFPVVDVTEIPDEVIRDHRSIAALTLVMKHAYQRDFRRLLDMLVPLLVMESLTEQQFKLLLNYIIRTGKSEDARLLADELAQRVPEGGEKMETIAEYFTRVGFEDGLKKGAETGREQAVQQGIEQGRYETRLEMARAMLQKGLDRRFISQLTEFSAQELKALSPTN